MQTGSLLRAPASHTSRDHQLGNWRAGQKSWVPTFRLGHLPSWPFARPALFQDLLLPSSSPAGTSVDIQDSLNDTSGARSCRQLERGLQPSAWWTSPWIQDEAGQVVSRSQGQEGVLGAGG